MEKYYIENANDLKEVLAERKSKTREIQKMIGEYVESVYGIKYFTEITKKHFGISNSSTTSMLLRQVASVSLEDISCFITASVFNLPIIGATLSSDSFTCNSLDKVSRVKIPWISWSKKGNMVKAHDYIIEESMEKLEGRALAHIQTKEGLFLQEHHNQLRNNVFGNDFPQIDCAPLLKHYLHSSHTKPEFVHSTNERGHISQIAFQEEASALVKPPAYWYYPLYYLWFLDGTSVIFETYDSSDRDKNSTVRDFFHQTMDEIQTNLGIHPIVIKILPAFKEIFYCNKHIDQTGLKKITADFKNRDKKTIKFPEFLEEIADKIINYK